MEDIPSTDDVLSEKDNLGRLAAIKSDNRKDPKKGKGILRRTADNGQR